MLHKNIIKLAALLWCVLTVASCTNEDFDKGNSGPDVPEGLPVTLKLNIGTPEVPVVETKSLDNGTTFGAINDLAVLVYDENGANPIVTYVPGLGGGTQVDNVTFNAKTGKRKIYVLTNVGSEEAAKAYTTEQALLSKQIESQEPKGTEMMLGFVAKDMNTSINLYNSGSSNPVIDITGDASFEAKVVPPYSKITFKITKNLPNDAHVYLAITEVNVRHLPVKYSLLPYEKWTMENGVSGESVNSLYKNNLAEPEDEVGELATGKDFYMYENLQGKHNESNQDPAKKTPAGLEVPTIGDGKIDYTTWFNEWASAPCTYIEVKGNYTIFTSEGKVNHVGDGKINYRFFLGENSTSDFNIKRNTHYNVTLAFTGLAGKNELQYEWRVQADLEHSTFYPKGTLVIDGTKGDFGLVPFFVLNAETSGALTFSTDGLKNSDMMVRYKDNLDYWQVHSIPYNPKPISADSYAEFGVRANNLGIIHGPGQENYKKEEDLPNVYRENGTGTIVNTAVSENYTRRSDIKKGLIYRIRNFYIKGTGVDETLEVIEHPLLFLGDDKTGCTSEGAIYSRRLDQPNRESSSLEDAKSACRHGDYTGEGAFYHYLPTKAELEKIINLEEAFPLADGANYWTTDGLFKVQNKTLTTANGNMGSVRCIFKVQ